MAKEVTVLSLEGKILRGVRLAESGGTYSRQAAEAWLLEAAADAQEDGGTEEGEDTQERVPPEDGAEIGRAHV